MTVLRRCLWALLLLLPLFAGAIYAAATSLEPAASWSASEPAAAPGATDLVPARRAAGEAASQAGFLKSGTSELATGSGKLADGMGQLSEGGKTASKGASDLSQGMIELQAGTGQLGDGAVKVADGVSKAVDQVQGIGLVQGQIVAEIDKVDAELAKKNDPQAADFRKQLAEFKKQVQEFKLDGAMVDQLAQLRTGSREIANQLAVPGYGYHDGIYSATKGSKELAAGLAELDKGLAEASKGSTDLKDGATKVDGMAATNKEKIAGVQRALPADSAPSPSEPAPQLIPLFGFLIALAVMLGSVFSNRWRWLIAVALGIVLVGVLGTSLTPVSFAGLCAILLLAGLASALLSNALVRVFGEKYGRVAVYGFMLLQVGIVGWVWKQASVSGVSALMSALSGLMPLGYATSGLSTFGNSGSTAMMVLSCLVLAGISGLSALALKKIPADNA
ncbi:hypothetical protein [Corynebacterium sp. H130]|uniref:hypothetical protein n=1 Tax=Corynebacterium sp. H130 TaxID=3133444 RepID=UPI0030B0C331